MAKIKRYTESDGAYHKELGFMCPGCNRRHFICDSKSENHIHCWDFNNDFENPTIRPSVLVSWPSNICHSYITDGKIQFLGDCTHSLAGKTVDLPEIESHLINNNE